MNNQQVRSKQFLALTALEEFWDISLPILFLGDWCKIPERRSFWKNLNGIVLDTDGLKYADSYEAYLHAMMVYEKLLPKLIEWLNDFHNTQYSMKYWRLLIGPFLFWYIQVVYQRFLYLRSAYSSNPNLETWGLSNKSFLTCINTNEFLCHVWNSDAFNLQIFTQIVDLEFKKPILYKETHWENELVYRKINFCNLAYRPRTKLLMFILKTLNKLRKAQAVGVLGGFQQKDLLKLMLGSSFSILPILPVNPINRGQTLDPSLVHKKINMEQRYKLCHLSYDCDLSKLVVKTLPFNVPINFIEGYKDEVKQSKKLFPYTSKIIVNEQVASYDQYKFWMGEQIENGARLIGCQHGGCYGMQKASSAEFLECHTSDFFISWGWGPDKNVLPGSLPLNYKFFKKYFRNDNICRNYREILWVATISHYRYQLTIHSWSILSKPYLTDQKNFFNALTKAISSEIIMRLNPSSPNVDEIKEYLPNLKLHIPENRDSFFSQLNKTKLVVIDNASTTFLYALAFNVPTILFWDKQYWIFRDEAKPYLEEMEKVGIYHASPQSAAEMLNRVADNPLPWWTSNSVQEVRQKFCRNFVKITHNYLSEWRKLLRDLQIDAPINI